jgi:hypothetical protein
MIHDLLPASDEERRRQYVQLAEAADAQGLKSLGSIREGFRDVAKGWRGLAAPLNTGGR